MIDAILAAHADPDQPGATFRAIDAALAHDPGHILFTVLVHHPALRQSERCYTNKPDAYPIGGRKPVTDSPWMQRVIHGGQPYIGRERHDIEQNFFDHALIVSLGYESILNMPVRWRGQTMGTLDENHLPRLRLVAQFALIFLFGYLEPRGSYAAFSAVQDASPARFDRIAIHTASGVLIITGLLGNDRLGRSLATPPFRLLGRLSFPVYLFHFPLLCSLACALFVLMRPSMSLQGTLLLIAAVYTPVLIGVGYLFTCVDEAWLGWVNRFAVRLSRPEPS